jgi:hypothetical protein
MVMEVIIMMMMEAIAKTHTTTIVPIDGNRCFELRLMKKTRLRPILYGG